MKPSSFLFALLVILAAGSGCNQGGMFGIRGEGPVVERKLDLHAFKGIRVPGSAHIYLTQGTRQEVTVEGQENIIENLTREVYDETWKIGNKASVWETKPLIIRITMEDLRSVHVSGSAEVETTNHFTGGKDLDIRLSGSGKIRLDIDARDIDAGISGSGDVSLAGTAHNLDLSISGSGNIFSDELKAVKAVVRVSGSGGIDLDVSDQLDARISGSGNVHYRGNPKVNSHVTGSGSVNSR